MKNEKDMAREAGMVGGEIEAGDGPRQAVETGRPELSGGRAHAWPSWADPRS